MAFHTSGAGVSNASQEPDSLLKLIIMLVTSDETNLGFDKSIVRIGNKSNFDLEFTIQDTVYHTSKLLYDLGADAATGRGTRVFEVVDQKSKEVRVIKDCWIENRPGKQLEHDIVAGIKRDIEARIEHGTGNDEDFHKHFVDTCGYKKTDGFGGLDGICKLLKTRTFVKHGFEPELLVPTAEAPKLYHHPAKDKIADQDHLVLPTEGERDPLTPPHPRFRYQVVYSEKGKSLFEVTSFSDAFGYLVQAADGMLKVFVNANTGLHCEPSPALLAQSWMGASGFYPGQHHRSRDDSKNIRF